MNRYEKTFADLKAQNRMAFIPFAVAGDPCIETSEEIFIAYLKAGADILEIGYPFSDPVADGPINQRAAQRAIDAGLTPDTFFRMIGRIRAKTEAPFGLLTYANIVLNAGYRHFCRKAANAGIDSILVADMPPEESEELLKEMKECGIRSVFIVTELTPAHRVKKICSLTNGFIYVVSRLGTTGVRQDFSLSVKSTIGRLKKIARSPLCAGFGISSPEHVTKVREAGADGAIVGSRLVDIIEKISGNKKDMLNSLEKAVKTMAHAAHTPY
jgi:tryptophan synthase alpha chain